MSKGLFWKLFIILLALAGVGIFLLVFKTGYTISRISIDSDSNSGIVYGGVDDGTLVQLPIAEEVEPVTLSTYTNRITFLLLGIRGEDDPWGGLLTDAVMLASVEKNTGEISLISVPRDLFLTIPDAKIRTKINAAYALGVENGGSKMGLSYAKNTVEWVTGVHIDHVALIDFVAFDELIEVVGGVDVYLSQPFIETSQWGCDQNGGRCQTFSLPAGINHLEGENALYYVRSRYSSSDFDRARREQQVLVALAKKATSLGIILNPVKVFNILDILGSHVKTDMSLGEMKDMLSIARDFSFDENNIHRAQLDNSPDGYLVSSLVQSQYVLLPKGGDFDSIRSFVRDSLQ